MVPIIGLSVLIPVVITVLVLAIREQERTHRHEEKVRLSGEASE